MTLNFRMSVKSESKVVYHDDVESGQCSDDEVQIKKERKSRKHKRREKTRKSRKRKHSSSSSDDLSSSDFFNPYSVNLEKLFIKDEFVQMTEAANEVFVNNEIVVTNDAVIPGIFNNLDTTSESVKTVDSINPGDCGGSLNNHLAKAHPSPKRPLYEESFRESVKQFQIQELIKRREAECRNDISGIDTITSNLYHYLLDLGLSPSLVDDIVKVLKNDEEVKSVNEQDDDAYEEEMINDIPIIDQSTQLQDSFCNGGYSPEHAKDLVEPYKPQQHVAYAPPSRNNASRPLNCIIDPLSIPAVGPRDPRLDQSKNLLQMKHNPAPKLNEVVQDKVPEKPDVNPVTIKEWETTVINVVKTHLRLYLIHNDINKEEYKSILKRAVSKILSSGEKKLETDKISKFLYSYVMITQKSRIINNV